VESKIIVSEIINARKIPIIFYNEPSLREIRMKKEIFFAVLLGLTLGLIVTYGVYRATQANTQNQIEDITQTQDDDPTSQINTTIANLIINTPKDETVVDTKTIQVAGNTSTNAFVIIYVNEIPYITTADQAGAFSVSVELSENSNIIGVHSLTEDGEETVLEVTVTYISKPLVTQTEEQQTASESATKP